MSPVRRLVKSWRAKSFSTQQLQCRKRRALSFALSLRSAVGVCASVSTVLRCTAVYFQDGPSIGIVSHVNCVYTAVYYIYIQRRHQFFYAFRTYQNMIPVACMEMANGLFFGRRAGDITTTIYKLLLSRRQHGRSARAS